jgi:hypothetical protein
MKATNRDKDASPRGLVRSERLACVLALALGPAVLRDLVIFVCLSPAERPPRESLYVTIPIDNCAYQPNRYWKGLSESVEAPILFPDAKESDSEDPPGAVAAIRPSTSNTVSPRPPAVTIGSILDSIQDRVRSFQDWLRREPVPVSIRIAVTSTPGSASPVIRVAGRFPVSDNRELVVKLRDVARMDSRSALADRGGVPDFGVLIDAAPDVSWPVVYDLIEACQDNGFTRVAFACPP